MLQEGLNYLSILTIENDIAKPPSYEDITKEFEAKNVGKKSCSVYNCQVVSKKYIWLSFWILECFWYLLALNFFKMYYYFSFKIKIHVCSNFSFIFCIIFLFSPSLLLYNWQIKIVYNWCFCICTHCEIIATTKLINISITWPSYHFLCVCMVRTLKIYSLSKFQVYITVLLTAFTLLYNYHIYLLNWPFYHYIITFFVSRDSF